MENKKKQYIIKNLNTNNENARIVLYFVSQKSHHWV